jgi:hypothetical protein
VLELITAAPEPSSQPPRHRKRDRRRSLTRIDMRSRLGKLSELKLLFSGAIGGELSPVKKLKVERASQLSALAEQMRGDHLRGKPAGDLVRVERAAADAVKALGELEPRPRAKSLAEVLAQPRAPQ